MIIMIMNARNAAKKKWRIIKSTSTWWYDKLKKTLTWQVI